MFRKKLTIMVLVSILLTGCGAQVAEAEQEREEAPLQTMEEDPDLSYEVPVSAPHILVNQLGYITQSTKIAVFCGSQLPDRFEVIDADTGKTVYTGKPESGSHRIPAQMKSAMGIFHKWSSRESIILKHRF